MSNVTQIFNDQRGIIETSKSFDSVDSVPRRIRPLVTTNERQFVTQEPINPAPRFRPSDSNQFQLWRQSPPIGRPPLAYPPPTRFAARNANEPRPFPARTPIPPLRTQEFQNRRSFEKPERPYDIELTPVENRLGSNSPWQRVRERLPLQRVQHLDEMDSTQMKISAFDEAMNREMNKDRIPPFRRDSIVNADPRLRYPEDDPSRQNPPELRKQSIAEFARRDNPFDPSSQHRPSLTQLQLNETNYIADRGQQNAPAKARPLQAVPEYEKRNYIIRNDDERQREDQNRNLRQETYREYRKLNDFENINKENRTFPRPDNFSQRSFENRRESFGNRYDGDMNYESVRVKNEMNFNRIDVNGVNDKNALTRVNDSKTVLDKKPTANGSIKPPSSLPELKKEKSALKTPTKKISPKSPEISSANSLGDKKKIPMNKVQVGAAPSPNLKVVRSKIGSLENYTHKPGGGKVKIENRKLEWKVQPKIEAKNDKYVPTGGDKKITQVKLQWSAKSKIGSLENATHKPGGGDKKIESVKLDFKDKAKSKVGSKDNIKHVPGGGTVKKTTDVDAKSTSPNIEDQKLDIKAQSKVGSLDNVKHKPGGGDKKIFDDKEYLKQTALTNESSKANSVTTSGSQAPEDSQICSRDSQQKENQLAASDVITPQNSDKSFKDHVKPKDEPKNNDGKRSQSTPKKSLSAETKSTSTITNRPTGGDKIAPEKIVQKSDTKIDQKSKQDSMPQLKPELKKIPSKDEINLKSKVPVAQPRELIQDGINVKDRVLAEQSHKLDLEQVIKSDGKIVLDKNTSIGKNLSENKPDSIKVVNNEKNNTNVGTVTIDKKPEKLSEVQQVSKIGSEKESNLTTKPAVEVVILKKQNSQSKIQPKLNPDTKPTVEVGLLKKEDSKSKIETKLNHDKKPATEIELLKKQDSKSKIETKLNPGTKPVVEVGLLKKQDSKPKIEIKSRLDIDNKEENKESNMQISKSTQLESDSNNSNVSTKDQTQSSNNAELNKSSLDCNVKDSDLKNGSINQNLNSKVETKTIKNKDEPKLPSSEHLENVIKDQSLSKTVNNQAEKPNTESNFTKINEPSKSSTILNSKVDDEKSKSLKTDKNQNDIVTEGTKPNSGKFSHPEMKQTNETFSSFSKSDTEFRPLTSTIQSNTISESKVTTVPVGEEKHSEKFFKPEMKQTTETFSPLSKSDTEYKPFTSESKVTNKLVPEEKLPSLKQSENPNEISIVSTNVAKDVKSESSKNKISEISSNVKS